MVVRCLFYSCHIVALNSFFFSVTLLETRELAYVDAEGLQDSSHASRRRDVFALSISLFRLFFSLLIFFFFPQPQPSFSLSLPPSLSSSSTPLTPALRPPPPGHARERRYPEAPQRLRLLHRHQGVRRGGGPRAGDALRGRGARTSGLERFRPSGREIRQGLQALCQRERGDASQGRDEARRGGSECERRVVPCRRTRVSRT